MSTNSPVLVSRMRTLPPIAIAALLGFLPGAAWATRAAPQDNAGEVSEDVAPALEPPSESDLMLEALKATRGESPNSARIERVAAEVRSETKRKRSAETKALLVWKDPFAEDPDRSIPVQPRAVREAAATEADDGAARDGRARRDLVRALARARAETAVAQASAAAARAEAAKAKATAARVEASAARVEAVAARRAAEAARTACAEPAPESRRSAQTRRPNAQDRVTSFSLARTRSPSRLAALKARRLTAIAARAPRTAALASRGRGDTLAPAEPDDFAPSALPPAAFTAGNGILVVPITR